MTPIFFESQQEFRKWLQKHHLKEIELIVGYYKIGTNKPSITWSQSVDQALCFGWIDGIRKSIDDERYCIRFTPRKKTSIWSALNITKVEELTKAGLMTRVGLKAFELRTENKSRIYAYEKEPSLLTPIFIKQFKQDTIAWKFFTAQAASYIKVMTHWIMSAKQEKTRLSRLEKTIKISRSQQRMI